MVLPLYLAMNASEMRTSPLPKRIAWMACHFSSHSNGLSNLPDSLPPDSMLILDDSIPCEGHDAILVAAQLAAAVSRLHCESILLDFQRPDNKDIPSLISEIITRSSVPVAVSELHAAAFPCPVFLSPAPLHIPLADYLTPWNDREIWLEAGLCQQTVTITAQGTETHTNFPPDNLRGGFYDETLQCHYHTHISPDSVTFNLFDTPESLEKKLSCAHSLGVTRAVGFYHELSNFPDRKD